MKKIKLIKALLSWLVMLNVAGMPSPATGGNGIEDVNELTELTEDGGWGYNGPHAVISQGKLFYSYLDTGGTVWVASYDMDSGSRNRTAIWETSADLHQASPLVVRPDGRIQVFVNKGGVYTHHEIFWKVSTDPGDISEFGELQESRKSANASQGRQFYPLVHRASGIMYLILNARFGGRRYVSLWKSPDGGDTWTEYHNLFHLAGSRCYPRAYLKGDEIHIVTVRANYGATLQGHRIGRFEGIYYTKYNVKEKFFSGADGSISFGIEEVPMYGSRHLDEIWNWQDDGRGGQRGLWSDIAADEDGQPYVAFAVQHAVERGQSALHHGYWATPVEAGKRGVIRWKHSKVATIARGWNDTPERKNYAIAIDREDPEAVFLAKSTSEEDDLSQIHRMRTPDGGKSWHVDDVLSEEGRLTTVVVPRVLDQSERAFDALWLDGRMDGWRTYDTSIKTRRLTE